MTSKHTKEQLANMRKAAQEKRRAEGGKLAVDAKSINNTNHYKRHFGGAFENITTNTNNSTSTVDANSVASTTPKAVDACCKPSANAQAKMLAPNSDWNFAVPEPCSTKLNVSAKPKKVAYMNIKPHARRMSTSVTIVDMDFEAENDALASGGTATGGNDIWASMTARKMEDEKLADISEVDEVMVRAWKRKHFYGISHNGTPVNDTCICGLMKPLCLAVKRMVERHDRLKLTDV